MTSTTTTAAHTEPNHAARHTWVPAVGAVAGTMLAAKAGLIIGSRNTVGDGAMAVLYLGGIAIGLVAAIGLGLRRRSVGLRVVVAIAAPLLLLGWVTTLGEIVEPVVAAFADSLYVREEAAVGVLGVVLLVASYLGFRRDQREV